MLQLVMLDITSWKSIKYIIYPTGKCQVQQRGFKVILGRYFFIDFNHNCYILRCVIKILTRASYSCEKKS